VKVVSGELVQKDEVRSGDSYISQSDMRLHFGLEKRTKIDLVEVHWPSGNVDKITDAKVNSIVIVKEGSGIVDQKAFKR
jgi:enediyne biosynthesis protein E4